MEKVHLSRTRIVSSFNAVVLALALPFLLVACSGGGGVESGIPGNSTSTSNDTPITPNSATLAWDAVAATNLSGYRVYYGTASGKYLQSFGQGLSVGNITSYTLMGLSNGTRYYFAVTAIDTTGHETGYSNEAIKDIP
jgi:fibronectin type 3 domain-containing protein